MMCSAKQLSLLTTKGIKIDGNEGWHNDQL
jgi:hypothetical protein